MCEMRIKRIIALLKTSFDKLPLTLPKMAYEKLIQAGVKYLEITTPQISMTLDLETLKAIYKDASGSQITIYAHDAQKADLSKLSEQAEKAVGSRPAYVLTIMSNGKSIRDFEKGGVAITLPYKPNEKEQNGSLFLVYVDDAGKTEYMTNSSYSHDLQSVIGQTNHFSLYGIGFKENSQTFSDIKDHWTKNDIEFVIARGLFSGTGEPNFHQMPQ